MFHYEFSKACLMMGLYEISCQDLNRINLLLVTVYVFIRLCVRVGDLLTWGNNVYHGIISLRGDVRVHDTITSPLFLLNTFYWGAVTKPEKRTVMRMSVTGNVTIYLFLRFWYFILKLFWECGIFPPPFHTFNFATCSKPGKWTVMYWCVSVNDFSTLRLC